MDKYVIYGSVSATVVLGEYDAESEEEAIKMAENDPTADWNPSLCNQCSHQVDLGDVYEVIAEKINEDGR